MNSFGNYPLGAEYDSNAPWNQEENPEVEVEAQVTITLTKTFKFKTQNYTVDYDGPDEDGDTTIIRNFEDSDLLEQIKENFILPQDASKYVDYWKYPGVANDLSGWQVVNQITCKKL